MAVDEEFVEADNPTLVVTCYDQDGAVLDLTSYSATLRMKNGNAAVQERGMSIQAPPTGGKVEYRFADADLTPGTVRAEITLSKAGVEVTQAQTFNFSVRSRLS